MGREKEGEENIVFVSFYSVKRAVVITCVALTFAVVALGVWYLLWNPSGAASQRVHDKAGVLSSGDIPRFEEYLHWIFEESDVDIQFVFVKDLGGLSLEDDAIKWMQDLKIGIRGREERGVLFLYEMTGQRLRIEIGYGLEEYFPDAFINYLMNDHTRVFFSSGDISLGLRLMLQILQYRIRSAVLGNRFDPTVLTIVRRSGYLSGGAGASTPMPLGRDLNSYFRTRLEEQDRAYFAAQESPGQTYQRYLEWLALGRFDPEATMFTEETRRYLSRLPMSRAYFDYILLKEYGKTFKVDVRGDLALLYFTDDPFIDPHFFQRQDNRWQMDLVAEVRNTRNRVGGVYTWDYGGGSDDFSKTFSDKFVNIKGYIRIVDGDNRQLPTRDSLAGSTETKGWTKLHFAAARGHVDEVKRLLDKGENVDARNARGRTPLYEAAKRGRLEVVKLLIQRGAAVNAKEGEVGFIPLHIASEQKHLEVVKYLVSSGANVHARNKWDQTPLWQAAWQAWHQDTEVAAILIEHGADLHMRDYQGFTPLHMAANSGHTTLVQFLLSRGAHVNSRTNRGSTPLYQAAKNNHLDVVKLLLENGADINASVEGWTPVRVALYGGYNRIAALLQKYGGKE